MNWQLTSATWCGVEVGHMPQPEDGGPTSARPRVGAFAVVRHIAAGVDDRSEPQIRTNSADNDLGFEVPTFEQLWPRFDHGT